MIISNIIVKNFRSIESVEVNVSPFNVNVGRNNNGKTNFFESARWFFKGFNRGESIEDIRRVGENISEVAVEMTFIGILEKLENKDAKKSDKLKELLGEKDEIKIKRSTSYKDGKGRQLWDSKNQDWVDPIGADNTWNEFLPTFEYVSTSLNLDDVNSYKRSSPIEEMLSNVLDVIIQNDKKYIEFKKSFSNLFNDKESTVKKELDKLGDKVGEYLQKQFPSGTNVEFIVDEIAFKDLLQGFRTEVNDGVKTDANKKGDGMQRALMLSILQAYSDFRKDQGDIQNFIFFIDEAELHLHPSAQRSLKETLLDLAVKGDQIFINTHSSVLVADQHDSQTILMTQKEGGLTQIKPAKHSDKYKIVYELLGGHPSDLLLPANMLVVEGYTEVEFLKIIIERFYSSKYSGIHIIPANGDVNKLKNSMKFVDHAYEYFKKGENPYSNKVVVLVDGRNDKNKEDYLRFETAHSELLKTKRFFELSEESIEEYYPDSHKTTPNEANDGLGKVAYAKQVARLITQSNFEIKMPVIYEAIELCNSLKFKNEA